MIRQDCLGFLFKWMGVGALTSRQDVDIILSRKHYWGIV